MRYLLFTILLNLILSVTALSAIVEGALITQIRGITNSVTIRSSSSPTVEQQPGGNGTYRINVASPTRDYILITPKENDSDLYSPRIIPASSVGTDTLYIIPPTNPSLTIIVDNKTDREFNFLVDKGIILNELATSQKDYELTVIPHHAGTTTLLIAGVSPGYPAVVKSVAINRSQRRGILVIDPQDIGLQPPASTPAPSLAQRQTVAQPEPIVEAPPALEPVKQEKATPPPIVYIEKTPPPQKEVKQEVKPTPKTSVVETQSEKENQATTNLNAEKIEAAQSAYYFSDRLVLKDQRNTSMAAFGSYIMYPNMTESTQLLHYGVDLYNIKIFKKYFDLNMQASRSDQLDGPYYRGSLTWHHSPYASIDMAYKSAQADIWTSQYDVSQTSVGVNGYYKSQGVKFQLGAGVRFQVDVGDFQKYFPDQVEKRYRYLQSFYLIGSNRFGKSSTTFLLGMVNEAFYASATLFLFRTIGVNYTFKNLNTDNSYFTSFEQEMQHRLSIYLNFTLKNREKSLLH